ncbi:MAG: flagellar basal body rod protein FlgB [Legionella sp.]|nr:flagellar basal body rod protein FlgB [Legionella sp.]
MSLFDVEARALKICESRATLLASNIANASTPHYKARDIDFQSAMQKANESVGVMRTDEKHLSIGKSQESEKIAYRVPMQFSLDENTVDDEFERKNFVENSIKYQAGLGFAQNKLHNLIRALRGE